MRLYHFSDDPGIVTFVPRRVKVPSTRPAGREWLNGPLVWSIEEPFDFLYHFPRDCPRILIWATPSTSRADRQQWLGPTRAAAYVERDWLQALTEEHIHRYDMPIGPFEPLNDAGMWVSRTSVTPLAVKTLVNLPETFAPRDVDLRIVENIVPLKSLWSSSLHVSGIRLRNSLSWRNAFGP